jgi:hypothetical protein
MGGEINLYVLLPTPAFCVTLYAFGANNMFALSCLPEPVTGKER